MKRITFTLTIDIEDFEDDRSAPVPTSPENPLDTLLKRLKLEMSHGRDAHQPKEKQHGPIFPI